MEDATNTQISEVTVLEKFEGDAVLENLFERIHIQDGEIIKREQFENGELVATENVKEVE